MSLLEKGYLLDTNHCIHLINGLEKMPQDRTSSEKMVIHTLESFQKIPLYFSEVTLGELYYGISRSKRQEQNREKLRFLRQLLCPLPVTEEVWKLFGEMLALLHNRGKPIADRDLLIACTAQVYDVVLVTNDKNFDNLPASFRKTNWIKTSQ